MHFSSAAIIVAGLAAQQAAATGWSVDANKYSCPANTDNKCSPQQSTGYDWSGLNSGSFNSYGSNKFWGFTCGKSVGKRDSITKRIFQDKCITGELNKQPSISCEDDNTMSIDTYQISANYDTDIECHYGMPDGSTCKTTHSCTSGGNIIKNDQCGGATSVTFKPKKGESGSKGGESCTIGVHSIGFNCGSASSAVPSYSSATSSSAAGYSSSSVHTTSSAHAHKSSSISEIGSATASSSTAEITSYTASTSSVESTSSSVVSPVTSSAPSYSAPVYSTYANVSSSSSTITADIYSTSETSTSATASSPISESTSSSAIPSYGTSLPAYSTTSSSVVSPETTSSSAVPSYGTSLPAYSSSSSVVSPVSNSSSSSSVVPYSSTATSSVPSPNCPGLLPKCLNTWIWQTGCKDNSDSSCYCKDSEYVTKVMACIESWSGDDSETQAAASYFQGICAPYIPENPAIITACPSGVVPTASPATTYPSATSSSEASPVESSSAPAYESSSAPAYESSSAPAYESSSAPAYESSSAPAYESSSSASEAAPATTSSRALVYVTEVVSSFTTFCPYATTITQAGETYTISSATTLTITKCPGGCTVTKPVSSSSAVASESSSADARPAYGAPTTTPAATTPAGYTSSAAVAATTPAATSSTGAVPVTTITYCSSTLVPATYSTGESLGFTIPSSSTYATIDTTITVPQVQFITSTITVPGSTATISVGLAAGSPSSAPAYTTAGPVGGAAAPTGYGVPTSFGTSFAPAPSSSTIVPYTGAATIVRTSVAGAVVGAVAALFML